MLNPVLTPEVALMLKRGEASDFDDAADQIAEIEATAMYASKTCNALTIGLVDEQVKYERDVCAALDKYLPNDGTPAIERRLRRQGLRKMEDAEIKEMELRVELFEITTHKPVRVPVIRMTSGDKYKQ